MKIFKKLLFFVPILTLALIVGLGVYLHYTEPRYEGRTLDQWLYERYLAQAYPYKLDKAIEAFNALRTESIPYLVGISVSQKEPTFSRLRRFLNENFPAEMEGSETHFLDFESRRMFASYALGDLELNSDELMPLIDHLLASKNSEELYTGIYMLRFIDEKTEDTVPHLIRGLESEDSTIRRVSANTSEFLGVKVSEVVPYLIADFQENGMGDSFVALASMGAAAEDAVPDVIDLFHEAPEGKDKIITAGVLLCIDPSFREAKEVLIRELNPENLTPSNILQAVLWTRRLQVNGKFAEDALLNLVNEFDPSRLGLLLSALRDIGADSVTVQNELLREIESKNVQEQMKLAWWILQQFDPKNQPAWDILFKNLNNDFDTKNQLTVLNMIGTLGPDAQIAIPQIEPYLKHPNRFIATATRETLDHIEE